MLHSVGYVIFSGAGYIQWGMLHSVGYVTFSGVCYIQLGMLLSVGYVVTLLNVTYPAECSICGSSGLEFTAKMYEECTTLPVFETFLFN